MTTGQAQPQHARRRCHADRARARPLDRLLRVGARAADASPRRRQRGVGRRRRGPGHPVPQPRRPPGRPSRGPLPLRLAVRVARGARACAGTPGRDADAAHRRIRPRGQRGALPARSRRQRDRALRRSPARPVAAARDAGRARRHVHDRARPRQPADAARRPAAARPGGRGADDGPRPPARRRPARSAERSTSTCSASTRWPASHAQPSSPPAAITITWGVNTWQGEGVPPAPPDAVGLREWRLVVGEDDVEAATTRLAAAGAEHERRNGSLIASDPSGNRVALVYP